MAIYNHRPGSTKSWYQCAVSGARENPLLFNKHASPQYEDNYNSGDYIYRDKNELDDSLSYNPTDGNQQVYK